ncbi:MAG TPA: HAMP domain-containing sensor histidine kinase [Kofleriaceae bacterium]|jgi:signal transduction histidine kinase|nr:HAMP domain-containing sensor histidine kinase [Kofleriaceae bacterium]
MTQPASLGRGLGRSFAVATVIGMVVFAVVQALIIYVTEIGEECAPGVPEDPPAEIVEQCAVALAIAAPFGVMLSLKLGRRLTNPTTARLDEVIESAKRMTGERLDERLPVSANGDPLDRLSMALNDVLARVHRGVAAQQQFAADASHELRTPLAVIYANLEVARRKPRDAAHWEHVADGTLAEVHRMNTLVDKLLQLSRAGGAGLHQESTELRQLAGAAAERATQVGQERAIKVELAPGRPIIAEVDPDAIAIVVDNLIRNAIDHSAADQTVTVSVTSGPPTIVVEDRGPGVAPELRARIFEPFARGRATDRAAGTGLGLGLAICKRIVDGHGGTIGVEDRAGGGARFVVRLPASRNDDRLTPIHGAAVVQTA